MANRHERDRSELPEGPLDPRRSDFGGYYARDEHRGSLGDDYARDGGWSGGGRADEYVREDRPRGPYRESFRGRGPKNWRRPDERVRELVNERLTDHDDVDATDIEVAVADGEVTLTGTVPNRHQKRSAEDAAWSCGVRDVHNRLTIANREPHLGKARE